MTKKTNMYVMHSAHLDLFWMGSQDTCLNWGTGIIRDAIDFAEKDADFHFLIETVRFLEYYLYKYPEKKELLKRLIANGQIEVAADYTDRMENQHDGESLLRNVLYGKKVLRELLDVDTEVSYHPDIPGFAEQMPQLYQKSGITFSLTARGFRMGARFFWKALDDSKVVMYDFPRHYAYYSIEEEVLPYLDEIKKNVSSDDIILSCSAGDLGPANTFSTIENKKWKMVILTDFIKELNSKYPDLNFKIAGIVETLKKMDTSGMKTLSGEIPSRWGLNSAREFNLFLLDKIVSRELLEAEKYSTVCDILGTPVNVEFGRHPLKHRGYSGGARKYFDLKFQPNNLKEYIDFGWRLQFVTQDHNYGGIDGAQSSFDKYRYKEAAIMIGDKIKKASFDKICSCIPSDENSLVVFNSMNWKRSETVCFTNEGLAPDKDYKAVDSCNREYPILKNGSNYFFLAEDIPSFGYKSYSILEGSVEASSFREKHEDSKYIRIRNKYYELEIDKSTGSIKQLKDLSNGMNLVSGEEFLTVKAYEDTSVSADENVVDKPLLEESSKNAYKVAVTEDNYLFTKLEIITEICNAKIRIDVILNHYRKELRFKPMIYWTGVPDVQLKLNLSLCGSLKDIHYGVPYGAQKLGNFIEKNFDLKKDDEVAEELYLRYREIQHWFAAENGEAGVCISSNHSAFDFNGTDVSCVLIRDVRNCGEHDVRYSNYGELNYDFSISSYSGCYETNKSYRRGFEMLYPLQTLQKTAGTAPEAAKLPKEASFIDTDENGILTVFKKSDYEDGKYIVRIFNNNEAACPLSFKSSLYLKPVEVCDFNENRIDDSPDLLKPYEIKAVKLSL